MNEWAGLMVSMSASEARHLMELGRERQVPAGATLMEEGVRVRAMCFVLDGLFEVRTASAGYEPIALVGPGEVLGELGFLDPHEASASVVAAEPSRVLTLDHGRLRRFLDDEPGIAAGFYRALGVLGARRLRHTLGHIEAQRRARVEAEDPLALEARRALDGFQELLLSYDKALIAGDEQASAALEARVTGGFAALCAGFDAMIGQRSSATELQRATIGHMAQREVMPFLQQTEVARRMYTKPRGYAGDFYTIELMYRDQPGGHGAFGRTLDRCFMDEPAAKAVRNRRGLLADEIEAELGRRPEGPVRVTSLACGPAREIFDVYERCADAGRLLPTLVDMDGEALAFVRERLSELHPEAPVELIKENLIYLALGRSALDLPPQDLVYSIGLIDYFEDELVIRLLDWAHGLLRPGGRAIFGNFHPSNTSRAFMEHVLEWRLVHRSEADMDRLFRASRFGKPCTRILWEDQRVNLFAECAR